MTTYELQNKAASMTSADIINFYRHNYCLSDAEYDEMETMPVEELRALFIEGEAQ